ncbi:MAG TPA: hypothetical protein VL172_23275 [Kofleriaceae bacterium]|jgi:hypothetical protein|nr:hypothetical protein [Kofleriaceae bacterium]HZJ72869.1 hypothetical protein [Planctomycetota bacterium]
MKTFLACVVLAAACGGGGKPAAESPEHEAEAHEHGGGEAQEHEEFPEPVRKFHDVLAPLWHMEVGTERTLKTCASIADLEREAGPLADATLDASLADLEKACGEPDRPRFDAAFTKVHESFHAIAEKSEK